MSISVAMCTYNGATYLGQQLRSIAAQVRLPDELIVCDDGSSDSSVALLQQFAGQAPFPVRIHSNAERLGTPRNFEKAIRLCQGDIIVLSDQDDVWHPERTRVIEQSFSMHPQAGLIFHNARILDNALHPMDYSLWQSTYFDRRLERQVRAGHAFEALLAHNFVTGATAAFRSEFKELVTPIPDTWMHDGWIAILIAAVAQVLCVDRCLIGYRQHGSQQLGARRKSIREHFASTQASQNGELYQRMPAQYGLVLERLLNQSRTNSNQRTILLLKSKIAHMTSRANLPKSHLLRLPSIARECFLTRYTRFGYGWRGAVRDLLVNL
jgi:hypothetical protein